MNRRPAAFLSLSALAGAYAGLFCSPNFFATAFVACILVALVPRLWLRIIAFLSCIFFITAWSIARDLEHHHHLLAKLPVGEAHHRGLIDESNKMEDGHLILTVQLQHGNVDERELHRIRLHLKDAAATIIARAGMAIEFRGIIKPFSPALSAAHFDGERFSFSKGLHGSVTIVDTDAVAIEAGPPNATNYFATMREKFRADLLSALTPQEAAMLLALLIGDTSLFAPVDKAMFKSIGAEHLLAVSGLQISLLAWLCFVVLYPFISIALSGAYLHRARAITALITIACLWWFAGLASFAESVMRALLMAVCLYLPTITRRQIDVFDALYVSCFITLLCSPKAAHDFGFLFSYAAVFGILVTHARCKARLVDINSFFIRSAIDATLLSVAAVLATLPIMASAFRTISPFAAVANTVLLPFAALTQIPAIVLAAIGSLVHAPLLIHVAAFFANLIYGAAKFLATVFGQIITLSHLSSLGLFLVAIAANCVFYALLHRHRTRTILVIASALCLVEPLVELAPWRFALKVTVIPVGQGDATLFSFTDGRHLLIDAGGAPGQTFDPGIAYVVPTLKRLGVESLDVLAISHPHPDHLLGAFAVMDEVAVKEIWHSGFRDGHPLTKKLLDKAASRQIAVKTTTAIYGSHRFGHSIVQVLAPQGDDFYPELDANDNSLVIRVVHGSHALLWPGDIEAFGERLLITSDVSATILKAPHHGSRTSSSMEFLAAVNPRDVIFSTGLNNRFHFPSHDVVARYQARNVRMWNTATDGEITISLTADNFSIDGYQRLFKEKT